MRDLITESISTQTRPNPISPSEALDNTQKPDAPDQSPTRAKTIIFENLHEDFPDREPSDVPEFDNRKIYKAAYVCACKASEYVHAGRNLSNIIKPCFYVAGQIAESLQSSRMVSKKNSQPTNKEGNLIFLAISGMKGLTDDFSIHTINVVIYSIKIGIELKYKQKDLILLGVSALLHDIGMLRVPEEILGKSSALTEEEMDTIKEHPRFGLEMISRLGKEYRWLGKVVYQEHEREDGSGYPEGLSGEDIHEFAKIIGITDVFEAMTHIRSYKNTTLPFHAVKEIIRAKKSFFAPVIIKALLRGLSVFPVGSYVKLNSEEIGRVISIDERYPLKPIIEVRYDSNGYQLREPKIIDLRKDMIIFVKDAVSKEEVENG